MCVYIYVIYIYHIFCTHSSLNKTFLDWVWISSSTSFPAATHAYPMGQPHRNLCCVLHGCGPLHNFFFFDFNLFIFIYLWLCWVFVSAQGLSLVVASGGHSSSRCTGLSLSRPLLLRSTGSRRAGSVIVAHGPSRSVACGIFPDQGSNPCPLHWQADSQPLRHQGSPTQLFHQS